MRSTAWFLLCLLHRVLSLPTNVSLGVVPIIDISHNASNDNSIISFEQGGMSFQGTRDDSTDLEPGLPDVAYEYKTLRPKMQQAFSADPSVLVPVDKKFSFYVGAKTVVAMSSRGPQWTHAEVNFGTAMLLDKLVELRCHNPVEVTIKYRRKLLTFTTIKVPRDRRVWGLPQAQGEPQKGAIGLSFSDDPLRPYDFQALLHLGLEFARSKHDEVVPVGTTYARKSGDVVFAWTAVAAAGATALYSDIAAAISKYADNLEPATFSGALAQKTPQARLPWTMLVRFGCANSDTVVSGQGEGNDQDDGPQAWSDLAAQLNATLPDDTLSAQNSTTDLPIIAA